MPDSIRDAPELITGLHLFMQAFIDLDSSRTVGMSEGSISWNTIFDYCTRIGIDDEAQRDDVIFLVSGLDKFYLDWKEQRRGSAS